MSTIAVIEAKTKAFADARAELADLVAELHAEIEAAKRRRLKRIRELVARAHERRAALQAAIEDAGPEAFAKPRTLVLHGIKVGYQKGKGMLEWESEDQVLKLLHKHFPDQVELLIRTTERPNKDALAQLPAADLKRLGITVSEAGDQVVIRPVDGEVDKLVDALLKDAEEEAVA